MGYLVVILSGARAPQVVILSGAPPGAESKDPVRRQQKAPPSSTPSNPRSATRFGNGKASAAPRLGRDRTLCTIFSDNQPVISEKSLVGFCDSRAKSCIACDLCQGTEHVTRTRHDGRKDAARKQLSTCHNKGDTEERGSLMMDAQVPVKPEGVADDVWAQMLSASPVEARHLIRSGEFTAPTSGLCPGYAQANLIVLPKEQAYDFLLFAQRNPKPCPLLEVTEVGAREAAICATDCDIATDFPRYRIYEHGKLVAEVENVEDYWRDDLVSFVIGCSFSFESELIEAGIEIRHNTMGCNVPMYLTGVPCTPAGSMSGNMVMSMRPIPYDQVVKAVQISGAIPKVHGAPIHIGNPDAIGVRDIMHPEFGDPVEIRDGEVPVFWACGVTHQSIVMNSKPPFAITHAPGCMLITYTKNINLKK